MEVETTSAILKFMNSEIEVKSGIKSLTVEPLFRLPVHTNTPHVDFMV